MEFIGDLHIHGRYAQACSKTTTLEDLERNARIKGLHLLGTGDCQHPLWRKEIDQKLTEGENGILWTKTHFPFIWTTELSLIYTQEGKGRRIHHVVLLPNKEVVNQFTDGLLKKGRIDYDGRPIFGMSSIEFVDFVRSISAEIEIIPAHAWTSWFSIFGSKSGFDSVEECFLDRAKYIHAIETGLSSDVKMNRRISKLDKYNLVSFSDPHSSHPSRLGREATIFDLNKLTYKNIINAIRIGEGLKGTIETNPKNVPHYKEVLPLHELIAATYGTKSLTSKKVQTIYETLIKNFKNEYDILLKVSEEEFKKIIHPKLSRIILLNRENKLQIKPGYDGVYGEILLDNLKITDKKQKALFDF